ncbi:MAG: NAD-dependent epimerase/dehydratase family protein [Spirochaetota bacterium]
MRILLAGYGFVGTAAAELLSAAGHELTVLRRRPTSRQIGIEFVACDLRNGRPWDAREKFDAVVVSLAPDERSDAAYTATYCTAQENLQSAIDTERYLYVSSTAVYPEAEGNWREEDSSAHSPRARILLEAEAIAGRAQNAAILRFAGLYNRTRRIYYGPPATITDDRLVHFLHRDDAARAISHALANALTGVFNVHDGHPQWRSEVLHRLGFLTSASPRDGERRISTEKFFSTGFQPSFRDYFSGLEF